MDPPLDRPILAAKWRIFTRFQFRWRHRALRGCCRSIKAAPLNAPHSLPPARIAAQCRLRRAAAGVCTWLCLVATTADTDNSRAKVIPRKTKKTKKSVLRHGAVPVFGTSTY
eukprot:gene11772-biopygen12434